MAGFFPVNSIITVLQNAWGGAGSTYPVALCNWAVESYSLTTSSVTSSSNTIALPGTHSYINNTRVRFSGSPPGNVSTSSDYYASISGTALQLRASYGATSAVTFSSAGGAFSVSDQQWTRNDRLTTAEIERKELSSTGYQNLTARPTLTVPGTDAFIYDAVDQRVEIAASSLPATIDNTGTNGALSFNAYAVIQSGSTAIGNTSGSVLFAQVFTNTRTIGTSIAQQLQIPMSLQSSTVVA